MLSRSVMYFFVLVIASFLGFYLILGSGMTTGLSLNLFLITGSFAAIWAVMYVLKLPLKGKYDSTLISILGTTITYNILLSTLIPDPRAAVDGWLFLGTPVAMLVVWYFLIYQVVKKKTTIHWVIWTLFIGVSLLYAWNITSFYYSNIIS